MKPRAVWVGGGNLGEKFFFQNFRSGEGYPGVLVSIDRPIEVSPHYKFSSVFKYRARYFQTKNPKSLGFLRSKPREKIADTPNH